jgi:hypothetical protein
MIATYWTEFSTRYPPRVTSVALCNNKTGPPVLRGTCYICLLYREHGCLIYKTSQYQQMHSSTVMYFTVI